MKFLVVGNGGREHAIASSLKKSSMVSRLFWTPGNAATGEIAENPGIASEDFESLLQFARKENIDITVVGPEVPLVNGMADLFQEHGLKVFGPKTDGAKIEGSKIFAKQLMKACNIPTAPFREFYRLEPALKYLKKASPPFVVKADGLAAGKGVIIAHDMPEAQKALVDMFENKKFGDSGTRVVIDGYMEGEEATVLALYDGRNILPLISSQDHKPVFDGDKGPNTGGMGAVAPAPVVTSGVREKVNERVLIPLTREFKERNIDYRGVIYVGLMIQEQEPYVLEFNCRLGDPEAEAVMPLLQSDFGSMVACTVNGELNNFTCKWKQGFACDVVMVSGGYPGKYQKGITISGLEELKQEGEVVFHSGTAKKNSRVVTNGGRVLNIIGTAPTLKAAIQNAYENVKKIHFEAMHYRTDIGFRALQHLS